jgi:hypothetical protein
MPTPFNLLAALADFQREAATICAAAATPGLTPNCCFDTDSLTTTLSIEVRDAAGQLLFSALTEDPLADLARQLGVTYPAQYATAGQKETLKRLLDALGASPAERAKCLMRLHQYTFQEIEALNADLTKRVGIAVASEAQRESLAIQQRLAA